MVATTGARLLPENAIKSVLDRLLPLTTVLTPNIPEAKLLLRENGISFRDVKNSDDIVDLARAVKDLGPRYVLVKGGHCPLPSRSESNDTKEIVNVLYGDGQLTVIRGPYIASENTHGTGCSLACGSLAKIHQFEHLGADYTFQLQSQQT
jgi:hydroxymethylpyrimidine kinase/phosphomethylpyrimidine kinase